MKNLQELIRVLTTLPYEDRTATGVAKAIVDMPEMYTFNDTILPVTARGEHGMLPWTVLAGNIGAESLLDQVFLATIKVVQTDQSVTTALAFCTIGGTDDISVNLRNALKLTGPSGDSIGAILAEALGYDDWTVLLRRNSNTTGVTDPNDATIDPVFTGSAVPAGIGPFIQNPAPVAWCPLALISGSPDSHLCTPKQLAWCSPIDGDTVFGITGPFLYTAATQGVRQFIGPLNVFRTDSQNMEDLRVIAQVDVNAAVSATSKLYLRY